MYIYIYIQLSLSTRTTLSVFLMRLTFFARSYHHYCSKVLSHNLQTAIKQAAFRPRWAHMDSTINTNRRCRRKDSSSNSNSNRNQKIVVIMGPTGSGKSRLSIDLATRFFSFDIINSDKIQTYRGLDITTNKIPMHERLGVPHHLLGEFDPADPELTPSDFRSVGASTISDVTSRRRLPLVVGGSNSFIYALLANRFDSDSKVFDDFEPDPVCKNLRYNCCFLWVDVSLPVLNQYLSKRVDEMLELGMFEELAEFYGESDSETRSRLTLRKAIGVPEFEKYFRTFPPGGNDLVGTNPDGDAAMRRVVYEEAVRAIKDNTCQLAKRQLGKILRLQDAGWNLRRLDATEAFKAALGVAGSDSGRMSDIWEKQVVEPSVKIVKRFLEE